MMRKNNKNVSNNEDNEDVGKKRKKSDSEHDEPSDTEDSISKLLSSFNEAVTKQLDSIESRLSTVIDTCDALEEKVEQLSSFVSESRGHIYVRSAVSPSSANCEDSGPASIPVGSNITLITLNTVEDYPHGSWLGDECNPEQRVRSHITPTELFHINAACNTPEKMALTLLDYLFDRETQACSNISGTGKHKKKQLDQLLIYGIYCHLMHCFSVTDKCWNRIKQNIDSKCRTAFRRKVKGLPLLPKGGHPGHRSLVNKDSNTAEDTDVEIGSLHSDIPCDTVLATISTEGNMGETSLVLQSADATGNIIERVIRESELIHTDHGDIQILQATPEVLAEIQQTHQIQILSDGHILATPVKEDEHFILPSEHG